MRISTLALALFLLLPGALFAQVNEMSLINLPFENQDSFSSYINLLYALSISAAGLLAVIKIIIAGVKYMLTDVVTSKGDAIREIKGALLGLLLILGAVLILTVINPRLASTGIQFNPEPMPDFTPTPPVIPSGNSGTGSNTPTSPSGGGTTSGGGTSPGGTTSGGGTSPGGTTSGGGTTTGGSQQFDPSCIRGVGTRTQGTVTYQYFNVTSCGFANIPAARTYLTNEICRPNPVLNSGNDTYYCKQ